jgi:hypothetical protein
MSSACSFVRGSRPAAGQSGYVGLFRQEKQQQPDQHGGQADEADLPVRHLGQPPEGVAPYRRQQEPAGPR